jgi:hypothetical protein
MTIKTTFDAGGSDVDHIGDLRLFFIIRIASAPPNEGV